MICPKLDLKSLLYSVHVPHIIREASLFMGGGSGVGGLRTILDALFGRGE